VIQESLSQSEVRKAAKKTLRQSLEQKFAEAWERDYPTLPKPVREFHFHETRKWRFDFAWPGQKVAAEIHGGSFSGGRHNTGTGQAKDCEKQREAVLLGWRVLPFNTLDMRDVSEVVNVVAAALTNAT